jgi:hypothetical protein
MALDKSSFAAPASVTLPLRGGELVVRAANVGTLLQLKAALLPELETLVQQAPEVFSPGRIEAIRAAGELSAQDIVDTVALLERADVLVDVVALLAPMPRPDALALLPDEFAMLFAVCLQVNADFFVQALPMFLAAGTRLRELGAAAAPTGPSSSPAPATP